MAAVDVSNTDIMLVESLFDSTIPNELQTIKLNLAVDGLLDPGSVYPDLRFVVQGGDA